MLVVHPHIVRQLAVGAQMAHLPVHRHEIGGLCQRLHELQLLLAGMPRDMNLHNRIMQHLHIHAGKLVDDAPYQLFVARNGAGREHHEVIRVERDLRVVAVGHAVERGHRLPLAAGGDQG